jgi:hypothetical protein
MGPFLLEVEDMPGILGPGSRRDGTWIEPEEDENEENKNEDERLRRLREAYNGEGETADSKARIVSAIAAHESRAGQLEELFKIK